MTLPTLPKPPSIGISFTIENGEVANPWYSWIEAQKRWGDAVSVLAQDASDAAVDNLAMGILDGIYGTPTKVCRVSKSGNKITGLQQVPIAFPVTTVTGWPAYTATTVSDPPTQAEVQALWDDFADLVNDLRSGGALSD